MPTQTQVDACCNASLDRYRLLLSDATFTAVNDQFVCDCAAFIMFQYERTGDSIAAMNAATAAFETARAGLAASFSKRT